MSGTIFFIWLTSAISSWFAALRISAWPAARKRWRKGCKNRMRREDCIKGKADVELDHACCDKFFDCAESECVGWLGGTRKRPVKMVGQVQGYLEQENSIKTQRRVRKRGKKVQFWMKIQKVRGDSSLQDIQELQETLLTRKPKAVTQIGHTISIFHQIMCCTWRRFCRLWNKDIVSIRGMKWRCTSVTLQAAVHLKTDDTENLRSTRNESKKSLRQLF